MRLIPRSRRDHRDDGEMFVGCFWSALLMVAAIALIVLIRWLL